MLLRTRNAIRRDRPLLPYQADHRPKIALAVAEPGACQALPGWKRIRAALPDAALLAFALLMLWPFLTAFHQSADDNFWQLAALSRMDRPASLLAEARQIAQEQGRIGIYPAIPLLLIGSLLQEYAWGRVLLVTVFGLLIFAFCHVLALRFRVPLTRPALLLTLCLTPMAAHHLPPNAYPLLVPLPLLGIFALHLHLASTGALSRMGRAFVVLALVGLTLILEYAFVAGSALAAIAVLTAVPGRRWPALRLHGSALLISALVYFGYRAAFPSEYAGNALQAAPLSEILWLQARHVGHGIALPVFPGAPAGRMDLAIAGGILLLGAWIAAGLLPALARAMRPRMALGLLLACAAWAWFNSLFHALTPKYQAWCRAGDCTYVDSRIAALGAGVVAAMAIASLLRLALSRGGRGARIATLVCAALVGTAGALTFLNNRASAREMAGRERAFAVLRDAACTPGTAFGHDPAVLRTLAQTIWWHLPPAEVPSADSYLAAYWDRLNRLGLACRPVPFAPRPWPIEFLGWSPPEPGGRWSLGPAGILLLTGEAGARGVLLSLSAYAAPGRETQRIEARIGAGPGCSFRLGTSPRDLFVPLEPARTLTLVLGTPEAVSPGAIGVSEDPRTLGVLLMATRPIRADETAPAAMDLRTCQDEAG